MQEGASWEKWDWRRDMGDEDDDGWGSEEVKEVERPLWRSIERR